MTAKQWLLKQRNTHILNKVMTSETTVGELMEEFRFESQAHSPTIASSILIAHHGSDYEISGCKSVVFNYFVKFCTKYQNYCSFWQ